MSMTPLGAGGDRARLRMSDLSSDAQGASYSRPGTGVGSYSSVDIHGELFPYVARAASASYGGGSSAASVDIDEVRSELEELRFRRSAWQNFERLYAMDGHPVVGTYLLCVTRHGWRSVPAPAAHSGSGAVAQPC